MTFPSVLAPQATHGLNISADRQVGVPISWYRGGTSKLFIVERSQIAGLDRDEVTRWICAMFGSPDRRQIDGVGGADQVTSKFAIIGPPTRPDADIDYTFCQVGIDRAVVSNDLNCGNVTSAVALYAIERGFVEAKNGVKEVRIHNTNDGRLFFANLEVRDGVPVREGHFVCDGVPGTGAPIGLDLRDTTGGRTGRLLPTGNVRDVFSVPGYGEVEATILDIANLIAFVPASAFGLKGIEDPLTLQAKPALVDAVEWLRVAVALRLGLVSSSEAALQTPPATPFVSLVSGPQDWITFAGIERGSAECDITARGYSLGAFTKAYWGTGTVTTGVAAFIPGTVPNDFIRPSALEAGRVRIAHPSGTNEVEVEIGDQASGDPVVNKAQLFRTARKIMEGEVYVPVERVFLDASLGRG